ncbi:MAG: HD domain-containing protein [Candidatus Aenigmarchaeota archaeon]|nr:HD domain-containing protein [Candidatus Aenigmarchaeota archaeon]
MSGELEFLREVIKLKDIERSGWVITGVEEPESVADHSFSTAMLAMVFAKRLGLNADKCIKMAIVHDIGEVYTGDIATRLDERDQTVSNEEKKRLGDDATRRIISKLPADSAGEFLDLWREYEERKTPESVLVKDLDILDYCVQLLEYRDRTGDDLTVFLKTADMKIKTPEIREVFEEIREMVRK